MVAFSMQQQQQHYLWPKHLHIVLKFQFSSSVKIVEVKGRNCESERGLHADV
jgi:hypothetical protein